MLDGWAARRLVDPLAPRNAGDELDARERPFVEGRTFDQRLADKLGEFAIVMQSEIKVRVALHFNSE